MGSLYMDFQPTKVAVGLPLTLGQAITCFEAAFGPLMWLIQLVASWGGRDSSKLEGLGAP